MNRLVNLYCNLCGGESSRKASHVAGLINKNGLTMVWESHVA